ncbi:MAG: hypothetical protein Q9223_005083 [Gallowayella weberi]
MVCAKCQKLKSTALATPAVKKKNEMYYGSPAVSAGRVEKSSATSGSAGAGKSKLLSKSAKSPHTASVARIKPMLAQCVGSLRPKPTKRVNRLSKVKNSQPSEAEQPWTIRSMNEASSTSERAMAF